MAFTLKIDLNGDLRRKRFCSAEDLNMSNIDDFVSANFDLRSYTAKYRDDEGDLCTLTEATLPDALDMASAKCLLYLTISLPNEVAQTTVEASCQGNKMPETQGLGIDGTSEQQPQCGGPTWQGGGPKWISFALRMMSHCGCLRPDLATALIVQWLPIIKQRAIRKTEKLRLIGPDFVPKLTPALLTLSEHIEGAEKLLPFRECLCRLVSDPKAVDIGMLTVDFLKAITFEPFDVQCRIIEPVVAELLQLPEVLEFVQHGGPHLKRWAMAEPLIHHGVVCDGCQSTPIQGPRFKCNSCADYDLCGACYLKRGDLHNNEHTFETILLAGKGCKGAKGKWSAEKGAWGKGCGWGKSFAFEKKLDKLQELESEIDKLTESESGDSGDFVKKIMKWAKLSHRVEDWAWCKGHGKWKGHHKGWGKGGPFSWGAEEDWCKGDASSWDQGHHEGPADWDWYMWSQGCGKGWPQDQGLGKGPCKDMSSKGKGKGWWHLGSPAGKGYGWGGPWEHNAASQSQACWAPWSPWQFGWDTYSAEDVSYKKCLKVAASEPPVASQSASHVGEQQG